jgi:hypothetical protein
MTRELDINTRLEDFLAADNEDVKNLNRGAVEEIFEQWLQDFKLTQPSDYFLTGQSIII